MKRVLFAAAALWALTSCTLGLRNDPAALTPQSTAQIVTFDQLQQVTPPFELPAPQDFAVDVNPLTGQTTSLAALERRPFVVKISNAPAIVRPQAGISMADHVFEHYAEGGLTRFSAVFYGQAPTRIGSIRSARLIDDQLVPMYDGLLAFSGASIGVEAIINGADYFPRTYKGVLYDTPYYWRDEAIDAPHNMFMNAEALWTLAAQEGFSQRPDLRGLSFGTLNGGGSPALSAQVRYAAAQIDWVYDPSAGVYLRTADGLPHTDALTGAQISAANVVLLYADHAETDIVESTWQGVDSYSIAIDLQSGGSAVLLRDGQQFEARWFRPSREALLQFTTPDGLPLNFRAGNTWFQVLPPPQTWAGVEGVTISP